MGTGVEQVEICKCNMLSERIQELNKWKSLKVRFCQKGYGVGQIETCQCQILSERIQELDKFKCHVRSIRCRIQEMERIKIDRSRSEFLSLFSFLRHNYKVYNLLSDSNRWEERSLDDKKQSQPTPIRE
jgi:hypothetical protein